MRVLLVNPNRLRPPVAPMAIEYLGVALRTAGHGPRVLDLCFAADADGALREALARDAPALVAVSMRNTDDCFMASGESFVGGIAELVRQIREVSPSPIVLGGAGFSATPHGVLEASGADYGVVGDGEQALAELASALESGGDVDRVPGLVRLEGDLLHCSPPMWGDMERVAPLRWEFVDVERYFREGGQAGLETKRGCPNRCTYCADPFSKGASARLRHPSLVVDELEGLLDRGIDHVHLCDSEANVPRAHLEAVCREIVQRDLGEQVRWYTYASPAPFDAELARLMRQAGCAGIDFGADSADEAMLIALGRDHTAADIAAAVRACRDAGIAVLLDLLLGGPGETPESVRRTIDFVRALGPTCAGASLGVRVYPGTRLARDVHAGGDASLRHLRGAVERNPHLALPVFYVDAALGDHPEDLVAECINGDPRFFFGGMVDAEADYNYNDNQLISDAIAAGMRGAYWHILARLRGLE